jgi:hypothetical protein
MPPENQRPLKVCQTCQFWTYIHKGYCQRVGQGVGRFWLCADWTAAAAKPAATGASCACKPRHSSA